jgi:hypothetical protein
MPPSPLPGLTIANQEATAITGAATRSGHYPGEKQPMPPPTSSSSKSTSTRQRETQANRQDKGIHRRRNKSQRGKQAPHTTPHSLL